MDIERKLLSTFCKTQQLKIFTEIRAIKRATNDEKQYRNQTRSEECEKKEIEIVQHWRLNRDWTCLIGFDGEWWEERDLHFELFITIYNTQWLLMKHNGIAYDVCLLVKSLLFQHRLNRKFTDNENKLWYLPNWNIGCRLQ